jgi:magnesium chelatase accessory protein
MRALNWDSEGRDWPNRAHSSFVSAAGLRWHVQQFAHGTGPALLLVHGTGAATHSWRALAPRLAQQFTVIAPDLPGHGFTQTPASARASEQFSLPGMANALSALLQALPAQPQVVVGHSAGAAILARMCLDQAIAPRCLVSLNGALLPFRGLAGQVFSPLAKLLSGNVLIPRLFAWRASDRAAVERLIRSTGSHLETAGVDLYARLMRNPGHASAALQMMANWDLEPLARALPALKPALTLVAGANDRTVLPRDAQRVRALLPSARLITLPGLGHLAHEERPDEIAKIVFEAANAAQVACAA